MATPLHWASAAELGSMLRSGESSCVEVTQTLLTRIEQIDPDLHAFVRVRTEEALSAAKRADQELRAGRDRGPLHGIPLAVKDLCAVQGLPTAAGTRVLADRIAPEDACVVSRLRESGAVLLGTLAMTEGAYAAHHPDVEPPSNPWNAERWSGVSSSGSGVATAAGLCCGSLGTDTGGSIRFPSAVNGLVGIKPTYGRVPRHGIFPLGESLDHVGPMTRSVRDAAHMLCAIAGVDERDPTSLRAPVPDYAAALGRGIRGVRIGVDERYTREGTDPEIVEPILASASVLRDAGAEIRDVTMPPWQEVLEAWGPICCSEAALAHRGLFPERRDDYGPMLSQFLDGARDLTAIELARALAVRREFSGRLEQLFAEIDLLLCPSLGMAVPPRLPDWSQPDFTASLLRFTAPFDMSGNPTLSLPCGFARDGLPLSMQLVGRHLEEELLCRAGHAFELATDWHRQHPPV
jgi:amidase